MIDQPLQPLTEPGRKFVALAEEHAADFATRAEQHDREGSFPQENIDALQKSGYLAGGVPAELGGMGAESTYDLMVGMSRLARGCASTAIAANMHMSIVREGTRLWRHREKAPPTLGGAVEGLLRAVAGGQLVACAPNTEAGTDLMSPMTEAKPVDGGYVVNGRKMFGTMSPAAQLMMVSARVPKDDGTYDRALLIVPAAAPGVTIMNNWDAMGMRASGSHDIVFENVQLPAASVTPTSGWGLLEAGFIDQAASVNFALVACFLGIAEAARDIAIEMVTTRRKGPKKKLLAERIPIQQIIAEIEIDLAAGRAIVDRAGRMAETYFAAYGPGEAPDDEANALFKEQQAMKYVLQRNAISIVDKAMTVSGGAGYMSKSPLSRMYRDVRAGPFMQPFAPYEALEYIGKVTLGQPVQIDR
ncbi:MAG TPA: acyl-CoA dehydrogenase family protein [Dehalococcoidia bacterium]